MRTDPKPKRKRAPGRKAPAKAVKPATIKTQTQPKTETNPKGSGAPPLFTVDQVAEALRATSGIKSAAARLLGCAYNTLSNYFDRYPELAEVQAECRERMLDMAEGQLLIALRKGERWAIDRVLVTFGADRGYGRSVLGGAKALGNLNGATFQIEFV